MHRSPENGTTHSSWERGGKEVISHIECQEELLRNFKHDKFELMEMPWQQEKRTEWKEWEGRPAKRLL